MRPFEEDKKMLGTIYVKNMRIMAAKPTTVLNSKLTGLKNSVINMGGTIMETILLLLEEDERRVETRRVGEEQRRPNYISAREAQLLADKAEAEERLRQDKIEMEERSCCCHELAHTSRC